MPELIGRGTTYDLPNFHGMLFGVTPDDTPVLSSIGGLTGGERSNGTFEHEWQWYDLRDGDQRVRVEGADAPAAENRVRGNLTNVLEIHQETVDVSYTKQAATGHFAGSNIAGDNPVSNEEAWQIVQAVKQKGLDIEFSFINGTYAKPRTNASPRRTRGLIQAAREGVNGTANVINKGTTIEDCAATAADGRFAKTSHGLSNDDQVAVVDGGAVGFNPRLVYYVVGSASGTFQLAATRGGEVIRPSADATLDVVKLGAVTRDDTDNLLQMVWENGGIRESETATLLVGAAHKRLVTSEYIIRAGYAEQSRNVGGVNLQTIETDFGRLNIMLSRVLPRHTLAVVSLDQCAPVILEIPGKGFLFLEPLAKVGASERSQLYGEVGLRYGNPLGHGVIDGAKV